MFLANDLTMTDVSDVCVEKKKKETPRGGSRERKINEKKKTLFQPSPSISPSDVVLGKQQTLVKDEEGDSKLFLRDFVAQARRKVKRRFKIRFFWGGWFVGLILGIAFGPLGSAICAVLFSLCGLIIGAIIDTKKTADRKMEDLVGRKALICLMRRANTYFDYSDQPEEFVIEIISKFDELEISTRSNKYRTKKAEKDFCLLFPFISKESVQQVIWNYAMRFKSSWRDFSSSEIENFDMLSRIVVSCSLLSEKKETPLISMLRHLRSQSAYQKIVQLVQLETALSVSTKKLERYFIEADDKAKNGVPDENALSLLIGKELQEDELYNSGKDDDLGNITANTGVTSGASCIGIPLSGRQDTLHLRSPDGSPSKSFSPPELFHSLSDLVNFDYDIKADEPIREYEMKFLLELEQEDITTTKGWSKAYSKGDSYVYKKSDENNPVLLLKARTLIPGVNKDVVTDLICDANRRKKWDKSFAEFKVVDENYKGCQVIFSSIIPPVFFVAVREFLQWRKVKYEATQNIIMMRSAKHPTYPENKSPSALSPVRADTLISGYIMRSVNDGADTELIIIAQTDVKGFIPKAIVNAGATRTPPVWINSLKKACEEYQKAVVPV